VTELTIVRHLRSNPERVWRAFTTAQELAAWLWPEVWGATTEIDLRVGGRFRIASSRVSLSGEYVVIEENERLVTTWKWDDDEAETLVTYTFEPHEGGTLLRIVHERFETPDDRDSHEQGWNDCLDRLPAYLS